MHKIVAALNFLSSNQFRWQAPLPAALACQRRGVPPSRTCVVTPIVTHDQFLALTVHYGQFTLNPDKYAWGEYIGIIDPLSLFRNCIQVPSPV